MTSTASNSELPIRPALSWGPPEKVLGCEVYEAYPEEGVTYQIIEARADLRHATLTLGIAHPRVLQVDGVIHGTLDDAKAACNAHWQTLPPDA